MNNICAISHHALIQAKLLARPARGAAANDPNRPILASLLAGRVGDEGILPAHLGLTDAERDRLWREYFPGPMLSLPDRELEDLPEADDLIALLLRERAGIFESEAWLAHIVVTACAGKEHLWFDLGLANRAELSKLLDNAFPTFARANVGDMKWKKFLYRTYCAREGIYVCPAPSCGECSDYAKCFAPEV
ncbi:MAG: nitrogen fixation protein NifQ [Azoarcus sp.]|jgi:nitrogen fixation protein NifQ|nr:nitrogen fixation protein NifQ [Azoarcus sp.]